MDAQRRFFSSHIVCPNLLCSRSRRLDIRSESSGARGAPLVLVVLAKGMQLEGSVDNIVEEAGSQDYPHEQIVMVDLNG